MNLVPEPRDRGRAGLRVSRFADVIFLPNAVQYGRDYAALEQAARATVKGGDVIMGPAELAFVCRFSRDYVVDNNLGFYRGRRPAVVAIYQTREPPPTLVDTMLGGFCSGDKARFSSCRAAQLTAESPRAAPLHGPQTPNPPRSNRSRCAPAGTCCRPD